MSTTDPKLAALSAAIEQFSQAQSNLIECAIKVADAYAATITKSKEKESTHASNT